MQFEDFDKKIKEAADHHHPAYNEEAWEKMQKLLDKHMPQEKDDRRRFIFFILIPVLLAGTAWLLISKPWVEKKEIAKTEQSANPAGNSANAASSETSNDKDEKPVSVNDNGVPSTAISAENEKNTQAPVNANADILEKQSLSSDKTISGADANQQFDATVNSPVTKKKKTKQAATAVNEKPVEVREATDNVTQTNPVVAKQDETKPVVADKPVPDSKNLIETTANTEIKPQDKKEEAKITTDKKEQVADPSVTKSGNNSSKKRSSFFISASAGPDISSVGADKPGKTKILAGFGLGYTIKEKLTIRTGFYSARKIYTASKEDYKPSINPPNVFYLDKIYADCKVYEIPLSLTYHFGKSSKHNFFGSAGLSSYLMKEEVYDYFYKYPGNPPVTYSHTYSFKKENNHYFSVLGISAGYQRNISNTVSIMAEPYLRIPLSGVGNGNVKLNSAGMMLTVGYKPFNSTKK